MRKALLFPFLLVGSTLACSSSSGGSATTGDAGNHPKDSGTADHVTSHSDGSTSTKDSGGGSTDAGADVQQSSGDGGDGGGGFDAGPPPTPVGTAIEKGSVTILGTTDDGYVVYANATAIKAIPEAGGTATTLVDEGDAGGGQIPDVFVIHNDVFMWTNVDETSSAGTLTLWSHTLGTPKQVSTTSTPFAAAASDDSSTVVYSDATASDASKMNLVGATMTALGTPTTIVMGIDPGTNCAPTIDFSGTGTSLYAVVGSCTPATTDGGADGPQTVVSFPVATWKGASLATNVATFAVDDTGTSAAIGLATGQLEIVPLAGGTPVLIDSATALGTTPSLYLSKKDKFVLYNTAAGALTSSILSASTPVTLLTTGAIDIDGVAASEGAALVDTGVDSNTGLLMGLSLASTSAAAAASPLVTGTNEAGLFGDAFTADSNYALYLTSPTQDDVGNNIGTLTAVALSKPGTPITVATTSGSTFQQGSFGLFTFETGNLSNFLAGFASATDFALTGSKVVFADAFNGDGGFFGQTNINVVDLSTTTAATTVMTNADPGFAISFDKKYIIYTISFGGSTDGIYTVAVP